MGKCICVGRSYTFWTKAKGVGIVGLGAGGLQFNGVARVGFTDSPDLKELRERALHMSGGRRRRWGRGQRQGSLCPAHSGHDQQAGMAGAE